MHFVKQISSKHIRLIRPVPKSALIWRENRKAWLIFPIVTPKLYVIGIYRYKYQLEYAIKTLYITDVNLNGSSITHVFTLHKPIQNETPKYIYAFLKVLSYLTTWIDERFRISWPMNFQHCICSLCWEMRLHWCMKRGSKYWFRASPVCFHWRRNCQIKINHVTIELWLCMHI